MISTSPAQFTCHACGRTFVWKPQLAGRTAKCRCGSMIMVPSSPLPDDSNLYAMVADDPPPPQVVSKPIVKPIDYARTSTAAPSRVDVYFPDRVKDLYLPLALIC